MRINIRVFLTISISIYLFIYLLVRARVLYLYCCCMCWMSLNFFFLAELLWLKKYFMFEQKTRWNGCAICWNKIYLISFFCSLFLRHRRAARMEISVIGYAAYIYICMEIHFDVLIVWNTHERTRKQNKNFYWCYIGQFRIETVLAFCLMLTDI